MAKITHKQTFLTMIENDSIISNNEDLNIVPEAEVTQTDTSTTTRNNVKIDTNSVATTTSAPVADTIVIQTIPKIARPQQIRTQPIEKHDISTFADSIPYICQSPKSFDIEYKITYIPEFPTFTHSVKIKEETVNQTNTKIETEKPKTEVVTEKKEIEAIDLTKPEDYKDLDFYEISNVPNVIPTFLDDNFPQIANFHVNKPENKQQTQQAVEIPTKPEPTVQKVEKTKPEIVKLDLQPYVSKPIDINQLLTFDINTPKQININREYTIAKPIDQCPEILKPVANGVSWTFWYLLICVVVYIWTKFTYKKYSDLAFSACFDYNSANKLFQSKNNVNMQSSIIMNLLSFFLMGLFTFQSLKISNYITPNNDSIITPLIFTSAFLVIYITKTIVIKLLGFILDFKKIAEEYNFTIYLYTKLYGIILLIITTSAIYLKSNIITPKLIVMIGIGLWGLTYLMRLIRGARISLSRNVSIFYLILYLCALEIVPLMLLLKIISIK